VNSRGRGDRPADPARAPAVAASSTPLATPAPPIARDPWAWVVVATLLPVLWATRGAPRGEPVAEDFDFLHRALLEPARTLLDGGGSLSFWRPLSQQIYYRLMSGAILDHPGVVTALHAGLLLVAALLVYRTLRRFLPGSIAAVAAGFPMLAESTRTIVCWPCQVVDAGAYLFAALALHETVARRRWTALAALLAALCCKEVAVVAALLLPFTPGLGRRRARLMWLLGTGSVAIAWAAAYLWVRKHAGLELPHGLERDPALLATPLVAKLSWAFDHCLRAAWSLGQKASASDPWVLGAALAWALATGVSYARDAAARARWSAMRPWIAWGSAWCVLSWAAIAAVYPLWHPNRTQFGSAGFGIAVALTAGAAHPALAAGLVATRLLGLALAPATPSRIAERPEDRGAFMDWSRLVRLQRLMRATREQLLERFPQMPHGAMVAWLSLPASSEYAFGGSKALQVWYRDPTLKWFGSDSKEIQGEVPIHAFVSYQERFEPQVVLVDPAAIAAKFEGLVALQHGRWNECVAALDRSDSLQRDSRARVFFGDNAGRRSLARARLGDWEGAERDARLALAATREDADARLVLAEARIAKGDLLEARAQLDTLLEFAPGHAEARALRDTLDAFTARGRAVRAAER
jgi:hypothetical protein